MADLSGGMAKGRAARPSLVGNVLSRAMLIYALLSILILAATVTLTATMERARVRDNADRTADLLQATLALPLWNVDDALVRKIGAAFLSADPFVYLKVTDEKGRIILEEGTNPQGGEARTRNIEFENIGIGRVDLVMSVASVRQTAQERLLVFSILLAVGILIFAFTGRRIVGRFLALALAELSQASDSFARGSFGPVPAPPAFEEFRPFVNAIARLGEVIREQIAKLTDLAARREETIVELGKSLEERNTLLREVHHRVKNNLQILAAFLGEGKREAGCDETRAALSTMERRVQAMASLYDHCVDGDDLRNVSLAEILESVSLDALAPGGPTADFHLDREISVPLSEALIAGIIVSDLVSRAAAARPKDDGRRLRVALASSPDGGAEISLDCPWCAGEAGTGSELLELAASAIGFILEGGLSSSWLRLRIPSTAVHSTRRP